MKKRKTLNDSPFENEKKKFAMEDTTSKILLNYLENIYKLGTPINVKEIIQETTRRGWNCYRVYTEEICCKECLIFTVGFSHTSCNCPCQKFKRTCTPAKIWKKLSSPTEDMVINLEYENKKFDIEDITSKILLNLLENIYKIGTSIKVKEIIQGTTQQGATCYRIYTEKICCEKCLIFTVTCGQTYCNCSCQKFKRSKTPAKIWKKLSSPKEDMPIEYKKLTIEDSTSKILLDHIESKYKLRCTKVKEIVQETTQRGKSCYRIYTEEICCYNCLTFTVTQKGNTYGNCSCQKFKKVRNPSNFWKKLSSPNENSDIFKNCEKKIFSIDDMISKTIIDYIESKYELQTSIKVQEITQEILQRGWICYRVYTEEICCKKWLTFTITYAHTYCNCQCQKFKKISTPTDLWRKLFLPRKDVIILEFPNYI